MNRKQSNSFNLQQMKDNSNQKFKLDYVREMKRLSSKLKGLVNYQTFSWFKLYFNYIKDFYQTLFVVQGDDDLKKNWPLIIERLWTNGDCALTKLPAISYPVVLSTFVTTEENYFREPIKADGNIILAKGNSKTVKTIKMTDKNSVFLKANNNREPLNKYLFEILATIACLHELVIVNNENASGSMMLEVEEAKLNSFTAEELKYMVKRVGNVFVIPAGLVTKYEQIKTLSNAKEITESIQFIVNELYRCLGIEVDLNDKNERNNLPETMARVSGFKYPIQIFKEYIERFIKDYNRVFKRNASITSLKVVEYEEDPATNNEEVENVTETL